MSVAPSPVHTTQRETEIITWLSHGKTTGQICEILGIRPATVEGYKREAMDRLGAVNVTALVAKALRSGIIS
jgi:DNA-binding CsgD family transcriptional regulator